MIYIPKPDREISEIIDGNSPRDAYEKIARVYGGKAAGRILSSHYLPQLPLEERIKAKVNIPRGFAVKQEEIEEDEALHELYDALRGLGIEQVVLRSSADVEDSFEASWAGMGKTKRIHVAPSYDEFKKDFLLYYASAKEKLTDFLRTRVNVVVDEVKSVTTIAVAYSTSDISIDKIDVTCYYNLVGSDTIPLKDRYEDTPDLFSSVDKDNHSVITVSRCPQIINWDSLSEMYFFLKYANKDTELEKVNNRRVTVLSWLSLQSAFNALQDGPIFDTATAKKLEKVIAEDILLSNTSRRCLPMPDPDLNKEPSKEEISDIAKLAESFESLFGFGVDIEVGLDDKYNLFQLRPIVVKAVKSRIKLPSLPLNIIFSTMSVVGSFEYFGQLNYLCDRNAFKSDDSVARVITPTLAYMQRIHQDPFLFMKGRYSLIYIGNLYKSFGDILPNSHGGVEIALGPINEKYFVHPYVAHFMEAVGEPVNPQKLRTPFNVQIVSDGRIGIMYLPTKKDVDAFTAIAKLKLAEYEKRLNL